MDLGIAGRRAIVCASSRGLGRGCAIALAQAGCELVLNGRQAAKLEETADFIRSSTGAKVASVVADVSTHEGQAALLAACPEPDILVVNNGGPPRKDFRDIDREQMIAGLIGNMVSGIELIRAVIDGMAARGFGRIVTITSSSVKAPIPGLDLSSGARAGLTAFLKGVSQQVAASNVTINHILPGAFDTDRLTGSFPAEAKRRGISPEEVAAERAASIPARRFGNPEEFGRLCAFLASAHAGYITGQSILIDGGAYPGTL